MSKQQRNNLTAHSKATEDEKSTPELPFDFSELETMLKSFNQEQTKHEVVRTIKTF